MIAASSDFYASQEIHWRAALTVEIPPPASHDTIASEREAMHLATRHTDALPEIIGCGALTIVVVAPASHDAIAAKCDGMEVPRRDL